MRSRKRASLRPREIGILFGASLAALAIIAILLSADVRMSSLAPGGGSFFSAWNGAREFLFLHQDPYGAASAAAAQQLAYGAAPTGIADPDRLSLPFYLLPFVFPLAVIPDPNAARGVWALLSQGSLIGAIFLTMGVIDWRAPRTFVVVFSLLMLFSFYSVIALAEGSLAIILVLAYMGILWAMQSRQDELAGALIALSLCMWEVGLPFLILVTWRVFRENRWRIVAGLAMTLVILLLISFLVYPGWFLPFLTASIGMIRAPHGISASAALVGLWPQHGAQIAKGLSVVVLSVLVYEAAAGRDSDFRRFVWTASLALVATPLIGIKTDLSSLVALTPSLVLITAAALQRSRAGVWFAAFMLVLIIAFPWFLFSQWFVFRDDRGRDLLFLFFPSMSLLGLYWTRWWFLQPPRTWLDEIRFARR